MPSTRLRQNLFPHGQLSELLRRRPEPEHGPDQVGEPGDAERRAVEAGRPPHVEVRRRLPGDEAEHDAPQQHRGQLLVPESLHRRTESCRRLRLRELPRSARRPAGIVDFNRGDGVYSLQLLRRLRAGRLARELAVHAQLRRALRARERTARAGRPHHRRLRSRRHEPRAAGHRHRRSGATATPVRRSRAA